MIKFYTKIGLQHSNDAVLQGAAGCSYVPPRTRDESALGQHSGRSRKYAYLKGRGQTPAEELTVKIYMRDTIMFAIRYG